MGFRFRKIFSLGKGLRINISKRGISTSLGVPGATLNVGKNGLRSTVGIPGSGLSFTSSPTSGKASSKNNPLGNLIFGITFLVIMFCCVFFCFYFYLFGDTSVVASTPVAPVRSLPIEKIIELTANAAQAQTMAAMPTPQATSTPEIFPTASLLPSVTPGAPVVVEMTNTPIVYYSSTPFLYLIGTPPLSGGEEVCSCAGNLNCSDFASQMRAQACFNYCRAQGFGNANGLDGNGDGEACGSLP